MIRWRILNWILRVVRKAENRAFIRVNDKSFREDKIKLDKKKSIQVYSNYQSTPLT